MPHTIMSISQKPLVLNGISEEMEARAITKQMQPVRDKWDVSASNMAKNTCNPIRKIVEGMKITPNPEKEMIALSIGDPTVFGNLSPHEQTEDAVVEAVKNGKNNGYLPSVGNMRAREAVAAHCTCTNATLHAKDVILTSGASHALDLTIQVIANPGQNILLPRPGFSLYKTLADSLGIECRHYNLVPDRNWEVDLEDLESQIDEHTACIIVNNPSNPCGSVFSKHHIEEILQIAEKHYLPIIADEIYANFVFSDYTYYPFASLTTQVPVLSCGGLTKNYLCPGWRLGWLLIYDRNNVFEQEIRSGLQALSQRILGPSSVIQGALPNILKNTPKSFFEGTIKLVQENADYCFEEMYRIPGLRPVMPCGAMYMMVAIDIQRFPKFKDDLEFTQSLVEEQSVFCLPAQCFQYPNYFRVVLTLPKEALEEACLRISEFCYSHYDGYISVVDKHTDENENDKDSLLNGDL